MRVQQLKCPKLQPSPSGYVSDTCRPNDRQNLDGYDCCDYWKDSPDYWDRDVVRTDLVNPEKFNYNTYRYQLFAKPSNYDCTSHPELGAALYDPGDLRDVGRTYIPPNTDIRALQQTTFIPVIPTKPGGERDVTFPMTARTLGQPDVTTACCVPVIPCQPGFKNLTEHIKPTAQEICSQGNYCSQPSHLQHNPCNNSGTLQCCDSFSSQCITPPSNVAGTGFNGLPDTFPQVKMRHSLPGHDPCSLPNYTHNNVPNYTGVLSCFDNDDGTAEHIPTGKCMNVKTFRHKDRVQRSINSNAETRQQWDSRIHSPYGHFGSHLVGRITIKRYLPPPTGSKLKEQGLGHHWEYPEHENNQCYVLGRNERY